jgi:predicted component of type VI protein secretion system
MADRFVLITSYAGSQINKRLEFQLSNPQISTIKTSVTIGRLETCDFTVVGWGEFNRAVSRVHCTIFRSGDDVYLKDGDGDSTSTHGTYWGTRQLDKGEELLLPIDRDDEIIRLPAGGEPRFRLVVRVTPVSTIRLECPETPAEDTIRVCPEVQAIAAQVAELEQAIAYLQSQIDELKGG